LGGEFNFNLYQSVQRYNGVLHMTVLCNLFLVNESVFIINKQFHKVTSFYFKRNMVEE